MIEEISSILNEYGLNDLEIRIYSYLVTKKELTGYAIAKATKIHRSNCYNVLESLIKKGFVCISQINTKKTYSANDLTKVLGRIKSKEALIMSLMPLISKLESTEDTFVKFANSPNSFVEIDTKLYALAKENKLTFGYMIGNAPQLTTRSSRPLISRLLSELAKLGSLKKMDCRAIWDEHFRKNAFAQQFSKLGKNRFLTKLPSRATMMIYDNHVLFFFLSENDSYIEIKNKAISNELKIYFEYLWEIARK